MQVQDLSTEAFGDLLRKHHKPASFRDALRQSTRLLPANDAKPPIPVPTLAEMARPCSDPKAMGRDHRQVTPHAPQLARMLNAHGCYASSK
jgi:hypothetical protein